MRNDRFPCGLLILAVAVLKNPCAAAVTQPVQTQEVVMAPQDVSIALNRPSRESEVQRAPADGQQLDTNPPVFVWLPVEGAKGYILQYSQDPKFRDASTATVKKTSEKRTEHEVMPYQGPATVRYTVHPVTMHVLNRPLLPGKWYWRYGVDAGGSTGVVFGKTRAFSIRPDATAIPFPDVKQIIARLSRMRPRILVTPDSVAHLRELGRTTMKAEIDAMKRDCDPSVGQRLLPEPAFVPADTRDPGLGAGVHQSDERDAALFRPHGGVRGALSAHGGREVRSGGEATPLAHRLLGSEREHQPGEQR